MQCSKFRQFPTLDDKLEFGRLFDRQVGRHHTLRTLPDRVTSEQSHRVWNREPECVVVPETRFL
jgi:hypothetical protein